MYTCSLCGKTKTETVEYGVVHTISYENAFTESLLKEPRITEGRPGVRIEIRTEVLMDADLELYVNGEFICKQTVENADDGSYYWAFSFVMPDEDVVIQLKPDGEIW